ncbi:acyl-CoA dehydrogenase family protein [Ilumatobacter sp.]|uniref:acyl-CoA dehydrogenase family protein n=1 Tax=Ilumatobacter sp. TaxID=1967498 RepID=UPI0037507C5F
MIFTPNAIRADEDRLRREVREFLKSELPADHSPGLGMSADHDPAFSAALAARGWVGMALPSRYGGHDRGAVDRFVVVEELLSAGAPIGAHWIADRQTGPLILRFGTEDQRQRFLPEIAAGKCWFSIGMSEPDAGSDLAAVRTRAERGDGGWIVNGTKVWTSGAHINHYFIILCRTSASEDDRHHGLSQMIVDLGSSGITINPIPFLDGSHHFNEVVLEDVFVPDELVVGEVGHGWTQVTSELAYERAGPDRYMSVFQLLQQALSHRPELVAEHAAAFGRLVARMATLRQASLGVAVAIDDGEAPAVQAAMVKDLGTTFEQETVAVLRDLIDEPVSVDDHRDLFASLLARATLTAPSFTLRGGTNEILRSVAFKGLK